MKGKEQFSTLNMVKSLLFSQLGWNCQHKWQPDLSSEIYPYLEFQNSKLDGVELVGKLTLPDITSMRDHPWIMNFSGPNVPKKQGNKTALFWKKMKYLQFIFNPWFLINNSHVFLLFMKSYSFMHFPNILC